MIALLAGLTGCVNQRWAEYDNSLFEVSMAPSLDSYQAHVDLLTKWSESKEGLPPGLAAEMGFYVALLGRSVEAEGWYAKEELAYPEFAQFIAALRVVSSGDSIPVTEAPGEQVPSQVDLTESETSK